MPQCIIKLDKIQYNLICLLRLPYGVRIQTADIHQK